MLLADRGLHKVSLGDPAEACPLGPEGGRGALVQDPAACACLRRHIFVSGEVSAVVVEDSCARAGVASFPRARNVDHNGTYFYPRQTYGTPLTPGRNVCSRRCGTIVAGSHFAGE